MTTTPGSTPPHDPSQYGQPIQPAQFGQSGDQPVQPQQYGQPGQYPQPGAGGQPDMYGRAPGQSGSRPGAVTAAAVLSWIGAAALLFVGVSMMIAGAIDPAELEEFSDVGLTGADLENLEAAGTLGIVYSLWAVLLVVMAIFAFRGAGWARWVVVAMGVGAIIYNVLDLVTGNVLGLVAMIWIGVATGLLFSGRARAWYRDRHANQSKPTHYAG